MRVCRTAGVMGGAGSSFPQKDLLLLRPFQFLLRTYATPGLATVTLSLLALLSLAFSLPPENPPPQTETVHRKAEEKDKHPQKDYRVCPSHPPAL